MRGTGLTEGNKPWKTHALGLMGNDPKSSRYADYDGRYEPRSDQQWVTELLDKSTRLDTPDGIKLIGDCPRCGDEMDAFVPTAAEAGVYEFEPGESIVVACNCQMPHENRAEGRHGCGIYGKIDAR
jgi:hypothetical protein